MDGNRVRRLGKTAGRIAAGAAAAALSVGLVFAPSGKGDDIPSQAAGIASTAVISRDEERLGDSQLSEKQRHFLRTKGAAFSLRDGVWAAGSFLGTLLFQILLLALKSLFSFLSGAPIGGMFSFLGSWLTAFAVLLALFCWIYKKLFPHRSLRSFFTSRHLLILAASALAVTVSKTIFLRENPEGAFWLALLHALLCQGILFFCALALFRPPDRRWTAVKGFFAGPEGFACALGGVVWALAAAGLNAWISSVPAMKALGPFLLLWLAVLGSVLLLGRIVLSRKKRASAPQP